MEFVIPSKKEVWKARVLAAACRDFEELLARPAGRHAEEAEDLLSAPFRELAQKDSAWEGLDEAEIATAAPLLLGPRGLLELTESAGNDNGGGCVLFRRSALEATARFLDLYGARRAASPTLRRRSLRVAEACLSIFRNDVDNKVGLNALLCMLKTFEVPDIPLPADGLGDELLRELKLRHSKLTAGQNSMLHRVLAVLADARAAAGRPVRGGSGPIGLVCELRTRLLGTLQRETALSKPTLELVTGLLESASVLLRRHAAEFSEEELQRLYNIATSVALEESPSTRLGPRRAALQLFQDHAFVFRRLFAREALVVTERKPGDRALAAGTPSDAERRGKGKLKWDEGFAIAAEDAGHHRRVAARRRLGGPRHADRRVAGANPRRCIKRHARAEVRQGSPCGPNEVPWPSEDGAFHCEAFEEAWKRAEAFLNDNMPPWDLLNRGTLQLGLLPATVTQALQVRQNFSWAAEVPEEIWLNYVLPYASVNEARTDWRRLLFEALKIDAAKRSLAEVTQLVNEKLWSAVRNDTTIVFKAQQTPLIYDTMSAIAFGYASCTGLSIMFLDALRSVGVPARLVGTPAWHGTFADGNHNWVEIWLGHGSGLFGEAWTFLEASPAGPGEHLLNPCDKWFCNPSHFDGKTMSFAAKFDREKEKFNYYPMALSDGVLNDLDARKVTDLAEASRKRPLEEADEAPPPEAEVVRGWYPHFHELVLRPSGPEKLTGARGLGALVPAVARLEGPAVVLEILEVILDAAEAAVVPFTEAVEEEDPDPADAPATPAASTGAASTSAAGQRLTATALPELAEALSRAIPTVSRWLTGTQWVRLLAVGIQLFRGFHRVFTKRRPLVAQAVAHLLSVFRAASKEEREESATSLEPYEALVAQGITLMVTEDESLQGLWELILNHLEHEKRLEEVQLLADSLTRNILMLARQGETARSQPGRNRDGNGATLASVVRQEQDFSKVNGCLACPLQTSTAILQRMVQLLWQLKDL
ncbi:unnamed protein product [Durusdinium trenchii]|uniref:Transglutaminase-like domain-containing protein n=1 Tax=Durusdinium trenchii TaxID=1381693 RepID=A0ABP0I999_9DINO